MERVAVREPDGEEAAPADLVDRMEPCPFLRLHDGVVVFLAVLEPDAEVARRVQAGQALVPVVCVAKGKLDQLHRAVVEPLVLTEEVEDLLPDLEVVLRAQGRQEGPALVLPHPHVLLHVADELLHLRVRRVVVLEGGIPELREIGDEVAVGPRALQHLADEVEGRDRRGPPALVEHEENELQQVVVTDDVQVVPALDALRPPTLDAGEDGVPFVVGQDCSRPKRWAKASKI